MTTTNDSLKDRAKALKPHGLLAHWDEVRDADWLEPLIDRIDAAAGDPTELDSLFAELRAAHGGAEASRRWWAAFGATDASAT